MARCFSGDTRHNILIDNLMLVAGSKNIADEAANNKRLNDEPVSFVVSQNATFKFHTVELIYPFFIVGKLLLFLVLI